MIFKYLDQRDVFIKFYSKYLAKRLIGGTSNSDENEATIISGMKESCGFEFTNKLQRMFNDMSLCEELNQSFQTCCSKNSILLPLQPKNFTTFVLTQGSWPLQAKNATFLVPEILQKLIEGFRDFYSNKYVARKLTYLHYLCKGNVKTGYLPKSYEITVSDFQLSVLLLFNQKDLVTWADVEQSTALKESDLQKVLSVTISNSKYSEFFFEFLSNQFSPLSLQS